MNMIPALPWMVYIYSNHPANAFLDNILAGLTALAHRQLHNKKIDTYQLLIITDLLPH